MVLAFLSRQASSPLTRRPTETRKPLSSHTRTTSALLPPSEVPSTCAPFLVRNASAPSPFSLSFNFDARIETHADEFAMNHQHNRGKEIASAMEGPPAKTGCSTSTHLHAETTVLLRV